MLFGKKKSHTKSTQKDIPKNKTGETKEKEKPPVAAMPMDAMHVAKMPANEGNAVDYEKEFLRAFRTLTHGHNSWCAWKDFVVLSACSFANVGDKNHYEKREKRYLQTIKHYSKKEQQVFPELLAYTVMALTENMEQDFLGKMFMTLELGDSRHGQVFTPYHVSQLMADISIGNDCLTDMIKRYGYISIEDSTCGAGSTLIAGINAVRKKLAEEKFPGNFQKYLLVGGQDIDETVALMCYVQISMLGVPGYVFVGDSIEHPMTCDDISSENCWITPMYALGFLNTRTDIFTNREEKKNG